jgi:hypothetical protein
MMDNIDLDGPTMHELILQNAESMKQVGSSKMSPVYLHPVYLLYSYKSTNTDAWGAAAVRVLGEVAHNVSEYSVNADKPTPAAYRKVC